MFWIFQVFVNVAPGLSIVPSGIVSPTNVALAVHWVTLVDAASGVPSGVRVRSAAGVPGEGATGVLEIGVFARGGIVVSANGVSVTGEDCVSWACIVSATAVAIIELLLEEPQDVRMNAKTVVMVMN